jgi:hypothetical protein
MSDLPRFAQEPEDLKRRWIVGVALGLLLLLVCLTAAAFGLKHVLDAKTRAEGTGQQPRPAERVSNVHSELFSRTLSGEARKRAQAETLRHYRWVDKQRGVVRLPIDVAIELVAGGRQ